MYITGVGVWTETGKSSDNSSNANTTYTCMSTTQNKVTKYGWVLTNDQCKLPSLTWNFSIFYFSCKTSPPPKTPKIFNWMAWCKTNVSNFFGWIIFFFKSAWIFAYANLVVKHSLVFFWPFCSLFLRKTRTKEAGRQTEEEKTGAKFRIWTVTLKKLSTAYPRFYHLHHVNVLTKELKI